MLYNLYFLSNYNNYYNRELKWEATLDDYLDKYEQSPDPITHYNLNIADGVSTQIIVNVAANANFAGKYMLAEGVYSQTLESRWFITEAVWIRDGQYRLNLRRDLVADFLEPLLHSTVYVEKGTLTQNTISINDMNPLAFNQEQFAANQIKMGETPIKDIIGCKWLVGYLNKNAWVGDNKEQIDKTIETFKNSGTTPDMAVISFADNALLNAALNTTRYPIQSITAEFEYTIPAAESNKYWRAEASEDSTTYGRIAGPIQGSLRKTSTFAPTFTSLAQYGYSDMLAYTRSKFSSFSIVGPEWLSILVLDNKIIYTTSDQKYYRMRVERFPSKREVYAVNPNSDPTWYNNLFNFAVAGGIDSYSPKDINNFRIIANWGEGLRLTATEIDQEGYKAVISKDRNRTIHEAFDAFAIPYVEGEPIYIHLENAFLGRIQDTSAALAIAQEMLDVSSEALDLQLLPFCPLPEEMMDFWQRPPGYYGPDDPGDDKPYPAINISEANVPYEATQIRDIQDTKTFNVIFWLSSTQFSRVIPYSDTNDYSSLEKVKAINQLDTWRLSAGDYSSSFEFNMAKNGGVSYFEVDCAYKPYQPYIHVAPNFGGLYGGDYNDRRGLVCSNTNFSLPRLTDQWETYERNNLNYMNSFNRQIENMEINRNYQRVSDWLGAVVGAGSGAASGGIVGSAIAGGAKAGPIGAAIGGALSLGAGITDAIMSENLYKENKQYTIDQFNMSLQNIQAMPNTMAAVGALNPNNKVFPVLEFYSCSPVEREAFLQKMKWNGMTVGVITDNVSQYISPTEKTYLKGQIVYMPQDDVVIDSHELAELSNELAKGIIIDKGVIT